MSRRGQKRNILLIWTVAIRWASRAAPVDLLPDWPTSISASVVVPYQAGWGSPYMFRLMPCSTRIVVMICLLAP